MEDGCCTRVIPLLGDFLRPHLGCGVDLNRAKVVRDVFSVSIYLVLRYAAGPVGPTNSWLYGLLRTPRDDGLQGGVILACGNPEICVEGVVTDGQGEVVSASFLVLLLPDTTTLNQLTASGASQDPVPFAVSILSLMNSMQFVVIAFLLVCVAMMITLQLA